MTELYEELGETTGAEGDAKKNLGRVKLPKTFCRQRTRLMLLYLCFWIAVSRVQPPNGKAVSRQQHKPVDLSPLSLLDQHDKEYPSIWGITPCSSNYQPVVVLLAVMMPFGASSSYICDGT